MRKSAIFIVALPLLVPAGAYGVECGDVITTNTVLTTNVGPCPPEADPVLTVVGPAALDLNGHTVRCLAAGGGLPETGILLDGKAAKLSNGTVRDCNAVGVRLVGAGSHLVTKILSVSHTNDGFQVGSFNNRLIGNVAADNHDDGFFVSGQGTELRGNAALRSGSVGFAVNGAKNTLFQNLSSRSDTSGFSIGGGRQRLVGNHALENGFAGFLVFGTSQLLDSNQAVANEEEGIHNSATESTFVGNVSMANERIDIAEASPDCDHNRWRQNVFATASQSCVNDSGRGDARIPTTSSKRLRRAP